MKPPNQRRCRCLIPILLIISLSFGALVFAANNDQTKEVDSKLKHPGIAKASKMASVANIDEQKVAEKKQDDLFNNDEYIQIKPEEMGINEQGKDNEPMISIQDLTNSSAGQTNHQDGGQQPAAEHKSAADDELNAHLASDSIGSMESNERPIAASPRSISAHEPGYHAPGRGLRPPRGGPHHPYPPQGARDPRGGPAHPGPGYGSLRDKLAGGLGSIVSHHHHHHHNRSPPPPPAHQPPPRPYPGHGPPQQAPPPPPPHSQPPNVLQGSRYLPRGAAAGYAAFREFVRAHANRYRQQVTGSSGSHEPVAYNAAPNHNGGRYTEATQPLSASQHPQQPPASNQRPYSAPVSPPPPGDSYGGPQPPTAASKTKVSVTQAYIPHLMPASEHDASKQFLPGSGAYGSSAAGKPEHNKDFGMVIHYPQATVYTEPMSVDQVHKLTGPGISQALNQLQNNLSNGHPDESSMIRPDNKHYIGHGIHIHAKEYLAPGKGGQYVPTTAAIISTSPSGVSNYGNGGPQPMKANQHQQPYDGRQPHDLGTGEFHFKPELGSGYERVRTAAAKSSHERYNNHHGKAPYRTGNGAPSELEAIYGPQVGAQIQSYASSGRANGPIKYSEQNSHKAPLELVPHHGRTHPGEHRPHRAPNGSRRSPYGPTFHHGGNRHSMRPQINGNRYNHHPQPFRSHPPSAPYTNAHRYHSQQNQQQDYGANEKALDQQMVQMLRDFQIGDEQYGSKSKPDSAQSNQGYPDKLMQKYQHQQQQQQYGGDQSKPSYSLEHNDGLDIPQGPNDQIGEISELIDALKGTLESYKVEDAGYGNPQQSSAAAAKLEDVRYLSSTLGRLPTYAIQVPVGPAEGAVHEAAQKAAAQAEQPHQHPPTASAYQIPTGASNGPAPPPAAGSQQSFSSVPNHQQPYGPAQSQPQPPPNPEHQQYQQPHQQPQVPNSGSYGGPVSQGPPSLAYPLTPPQAPRQYNQDHRQQPVPSHVNDGPQQVGGHDHPQTAAADHHFEQQVPIDYTHQGLGAVQAYGGSDLGQQQHQQHQSQQQQGNLASPAPEELHHNQHQNHQNAYAPSEHAHVIEHLVPINHQLQQHNQAVSQHQQQYEATNQQQQQQLAPINQISIVAPTESQYQNAQSLSSFVDSLPTDYQDLLRQSPTGPVLESSHEQLLSSIGTAYQANATVATAADILKSAASNQVVVSVPAPEPATSQKVDSSKTVA